MESGYFYFLTDDYCNKNKQYNVLGNKEPDKDGKPHGRPCYYAIQDVDDPDIMWMVPISSKVKKYRKLFEEKKKKYNIKIYNGIVFGAVSGNQRAFLIQNMCPVLAKDIAEQYMDSQTKKPVTTSPNVQHHIITNAMKFIALSKQGTRCTMTDIPSILKELK